MFSRLPYEIRLLIWKGVLHQHRVVHINMRYMPIDTAGYSCDHSLEDDGSEFECLSSTPVPVLLHLCTETRILALVHYELTFGRANAPVYRPESLYNHGFSIKGKEYITVTESNEAEVAKYAPKMDFNFQYDTVVFGRTLANERETRRWKLACFPYQRHFDIKLLQRIENLAFTIDADPYSDTEHWRVFYYLNHHIPLGSFQALKRVYLCLEADDLDPRRGIELVDLGERVAEEGDERIAHKFMDRWRTIFEHEGPAVDGVGMEGVRNICKNGLSNRQQLRELLLKNGVSSDEVLKCVWVKNARWDN